MPPAVGFEKTAKAHFEEIVMCKPEVLPEEDKPEIRDIVIHAGKLIDGRSDEIRKEVSVIIREGRISSIENGFIDPTNYELIDLSRATILPGLIDCHVHLAYNLAKYGQLQLQLVTRSAYDELLTAASSAEKTFMAGFTSVRDVGGHTPVVVALKKSIASNETTGPRLWVSGDIIGPTGGHADFRNAFDSCLSKPHWEDGIVDAPHEAVKAVRTRKMHGADFIKIAPSGGVTSQKTDPNAQTMTDEEIRAVVETAHSLNMRVAAHAHGLQAINHATSLGVDSIEHGTFADDESYQIMRERGTWMTPTLSVGAFQAEMVKAKPDLLEPGTARKIIQVSQTMNQNLGRAYAAGVKIAFGTDCGIAIHGKNANEFDLLVSSGMTPMDAIKAATSSAAELIGAPNDIGVIEVGAYADIIATKENPLADITELERVAFVMKEGVVARSDF